MSVRWPGRGIALAVLGFLPIPTLLGAQSATQSRPSLPDTLDLSRAVRVAFDNNPELTSAEARVDAAAAGQRANWGSFIPSASISANLRKTDFSTVTFQDPDGSSITLPAPLSSTQHGANQGLNLSWDLFRGGSRFSDIKGGAASLRAANRRMSNVERVVTRQVRVAYFEALKQASFVDVAEDQVAGRQRDLEVARRRYEIAAVNRTDVLGAEIEVGEAELALVEAQTAELAALRDLKVQMGLEAEAGGYPALLDVEDVPSSAGLQTQRLVTSALTTKPEIRALEAEVEAASASLWGARATYLPTISLGFSYGRSESLGPDGTFWNFDLNNTGSTFSVAASWNIFDGFSREEQTARASSSLRVSEADLTARRLSLEKDVRDLVAEIQARDRRLGLQQRNFQLAETRLQMMQERYRLGTVEYVDLLSAIRQLTDAERNLIQERYEYLKLWARLEEQVGNDF